MSNATDGALMFTPEETQSHGASPGVGLIDFHSIPDDSVIETIPILSADGGKSRGILYTRGNEKTVVCFTHPRGDMSRHYAIPFLLEGGFAGYNHQCRNLNNDVDTEHEKLLFDIAAGLRELKNRGFEKIILVGNSGGGSLLSFYQSQAVKAPADRLKDTAAGEPVDLANLDMPVADGMAFMAVHPGEGVFMQRCIDPSVTDEHDPLSCDPELDMYNPANGFRIPPQISSYSKEFLAKYEAAQIARSRRIDALALQYEQERRRWQERMKQPDFDTLPVEEQIRITRHATVAKYLTIYRTEANPAYVDLSLFAEGSTRAVGSLIGPRPDKLNYSEGGFARYITPRAWLSSWSAGATRAEIERTITDITQPTLMVIYTGDNGCFPEDNLRQMAACPADDKTIEYCAADHYGQPIPERDKACTHLINWLTPRFPAAER
ncbi:MAG: hypothetical protein AB7E05_02980 [Sphingobium sp.]